MKKTILAIAFATSLLLLASAMVQAAPPPQFGNRPKADATRLLMGKVLDQTSAVARSMGWSDQAIRTTREYLEQTSKMQIEMIDQITDGWKQQLKSGTAPMAIPQSFTGQVPGLSATTVGGAMPEFSPLAPWTFWLQAAEMWQRTWMPETPSRREMRSH